VSGWNQHTYKSALVEAAAQWLRFGPRMVVTVTGKAFYDIAHAPADHSNRRHSPKDYAVWEIHPVMKLEVVQ
jgi:hypothetical protein